MAKREAVRTSKKVEINLRLSDNWANLWERMMKAAPGVSAADLLRQSVAIRAALLAEGPDGGKVHAYIEYYENGKMVRKNLLESLGISDGFPTTPFDEELLKKILH